MENNKAKIDLSLHPDIENRVSNITKEYYQKELQELEPIEVGQVNIHTSYVYDNGEEIEANVIIRNGLENKINFEYLPIIISDEEGNIYFRGALRGDEIGDIEPFKARPWKFFIKKQDLFIQDLKDKKLTVKFDAEKMKVNVDDPNLFDLILPVNLNSDEKKALEEFLSKMPPLEKDTVDLDLFQKIYNKEKNIWHLTYIVRNASQHDVKLDYLPFRHEFNGELIELKLELDNIIIPKKSIKMFKIQLQNQ
ncbi:MAG: SLAP domain-containing protein [Clostridiales bacterium]|nr:SLAP domain-containing protein [Clostridiales bacterium]